MRQIWTIARNSWKEIFRKKDFYVFFIFLFILLVALSTENFFDIPGISRYIKELGFTLTWLFSLIIAITFSAKQIPAEIQSHTICPLLAKPVNRFQVIFGKYLGSVLASSAAFTIFYLLFALISQLKGEVTPVLFIQGYIFTVLFLFLICAMTTCFSVYMTLSANITISFALYFLISWFGDHFRSLMLSTNKMSSFSYGVAYYLFPHFEFYDLRTRIVHAWEPLPLWVVLSVFLYTALYVSILLGIAYSGLRRKTL